MGQLFMILAPSLITILSTKFHVLELSIHCACPQRVSVFISDAACEYTCTDSGPRLSSYTRPSSWCSWGVSDPASPIDLCQADGW